MGRDGLQLIATLTKEEETCNDEKGLLETINKNSSHN